MSKISLKHSGGNVVSLNSPTSAPTSADVAFKLPNADGTNGQVLKTDGSGNLSFGAVTDNNTWVKLSTITASDDSAVTFTNSITGAFDTYDIYVIQFTQLRPASDDETFGMRVQISGSNYTGSEYKTRVANASGGSTAYGAADRFRFQINGVGNSTSGSNINEDCHGYVYMYNFEVNRRFNMHGTSVYKDNSSDVRFQRFGGSINPTDAVTGVSLYFLSGNIATGKFTLYGINQ